MKLDTISPQWTYEPDVEALTGMSAVQLLIWPQGVCVSGHDDDGTTMIARAFSFEEAMSESIMNAIFMNEPLLAGPQPISKIWIAEARTLAVPLALYNEAMAPGWLAAVYYIEEGEHIQGNILEAEKTYAVFPVRQHLYTALRRFFPEGRIGTFDNRHILCNAEQLPFKANIIILGKMAMLGFEGKNELLAQQFTAYETTEDIVYRIAEMAGLHGYSVADTVVAIAGVLADMSVLSREISAFYPHTRLCDQSSTLDFLTKLSLCAL